MAGLEAKLTESEIAERGNLVRYYGLVATALSMPLDKETKAMVKDGAVLATAPYTNHLNPRDIAMKIMYEKAGSNPGLAAFMKQMAPVLESDAATKRFAELYNQYINESKLSEIVTLAESLGVKIENIESLRPYRDKTIEQTQNNLAEEIKNGNTSAEKQVELYAVVAGINKLKRKINESYRKQIEARAESAQTARDDYLDNPTKRNEIVDVVRKDNARQEATQAYAEAYNTSGLSKL
jgi:hypothetical protein